MVGPDATGQRVSAHHRPRLLRSVSGAVLGSDLLRAGLRRAAKPADPAAARLLAAGLAFTRRAIPAAPTTAAAEIPRWLWIAAAGAVLLVAGLVLALVIVSSSSRESTVVAPASPSSTTTTAPRPPPCRGCPPHHPGGCRSPSDDGSTADGPEPDAGARGHRHRGLQRHRGGPGDQHHLRRHRRDHADRVQRGIAVEQGVALSARPRTPPAWPSSTSVATSPAACRSAAPRSGSAPAVG